jgi:hypothetical protein
MSTVDVGCAVSFRISLGLDHTSYGLSEGYTTYMPSGPTVRPEKPPYDPHSGGLHETQEDMSLQHPGTGAMQPHRLHPAKSQDGHPSTPQSPPPNSPPARSPLKGGAGGSRAGGGGYWAAADRSARDGNLRDSKGSGCPGAELEPEQTGSHHRMMAPKSHRVVPKSCAKNLPATPIVTAPTKRA